MGALRLAAAIIFLTLSAVTAVTSPAPPSGGANTMPCIQRLMPCQPYIHAPNPPPTCCVPLKEIIDTDVTCLCSVFNNIDMLRSLNLTKSNALDLPKACGANADVSRCKNAATPPTATPINPITPPASSNGSSSTGGSTAGGSSNAATTVVSFFGYSVVFTLITTIFF